MKGQVLLGTERFVESLLPLIEKKGAHKEVPTAQRLAHQPAITILFPTPLRADKGMRDAGDMQGVPCLRLFHSRHCQTGAGALFNGAQGHQGGAVMFAPPHVIPREHNRMPHS